MCPSQGLRIPCGTAVSCFCTFLHYLRAAFVTVLIFVSTSQADKSLLSCSLPLAGDCLTPLLSCLHQTCPFIQGSAVHGPSAESEA